MFATVEAGVKHDRVKGKVYRVLFQFIYLEGLNILEQDVVVIPVLVLLSSAAGSFGCLLRLWVNMR